MNNAVYWQAVEELLPALGLDPRAPLRAELDYRQPIDYGEPIDLVAFEDQGRSAVAFAAGAEVRAVTRLGHSRSPSRVARNGLFRRGAP